ncbi:HAD family hydrolase [candidate division KSB1 bacterium]|nr:HAD family hydrolase [candidate division KSB1 bacterium]
MNKAVFFDRDDTLIHDVPYLADPHQVELLPGAQEALEALSGRGYLLFIVSNQSGVGRGWITPEQVAAVNAELLRRLGKNYFADILTCYDAPDGAQSGCRKPKPGMLFQAQRTHNLDLSHSFMIGDKLADIEAGRRAGCRTALLLHSHTRPEVVMAQARADFAATSLTEIVDWILTLSPSTSG